MSMTTIMRTATSTGTATIPITRITTDMPTLRVPIFRAVRVPERRSSSMRRAGSPAT
jgi:hypothetical protein